MSEDTIFHKIIRKEIPADIVFEDKYSIAFRDINPAAPVHVLIVPKETIVGLQEATEAHRDILGELLVTTNKVAKQLGLSESGYRVLINAGEGAGQTVFQLHVHLLGGRPFKWPPF